MPTTHGCTDTRAHDHVHTGTRVRGVWGTLWPAPCYPPAATAQPRKIATTTFVHTTTQSVSPTDTMGPPTDSIRARARKHTRSHRAREAPSAWTVAGPPPPTLVHDRWPVPRHATIFCTPPPCTDRAQSVMARPAQHTPTDSTRARTRTNTSTRTTTTHTRSPSPGAPPRGATRPHPRLRPLAPRP